MSELIEVLTQYGDAAQKFVVDIAQPYVDLVHTNDGFVSQPASSGGTKYFQFKDSPIILSYGCVLPLGFEFWPYEDIGGDNIIPYVNMRFIDLNVHDTAILPGHVGLPFPNYEMNYGQYSVPPGIIDTHFGIVCQFPTTDPIRISMLNVPDSLDTEVFYCPTFVKVMHTKDMYRP